jgi:hypothetical protein
MRWLAVALLAGCFDPRVSDGLLCSDAGTCPPNQHCFADGRCHFASPDLAAPDLAASDMAHAICPATGVFAGAWCGSDGVTNGDPMSLYHCAAASAAPDAIKMCAHGCTTRASGVNDFCTPANNCPLVSDLCGDDGLMGDPDELYKCPVAGQQPTTSVVCLHGCQNRPGMNDICNP